MTPAAVVCLPQPPHLVSRIFLEHWLAGKMPTAEFLRWFHMPNSDYLTVAHCNRQGRFGRLRASP